jgi:hypothetical protein
MESNGYSNIIAVMMNDMNDDRAVPAVEHSNDCIATFHEIIGTAVIVVLCYALR